MGNNKSKAVCTTSDAIEQLYTTRAIESRAANPGMATAHTEDENEPLLTNQNDLASTSTREGAEDEAKADTEDGEEDNMAVADAINEPPVDQPATQLNTSLSDARILNNIRNLSTPGNAIEAATVHLTIAARAVATSAHDAVEIAITALKNIEPVAVFKAVQSWVRANPWETAAIVIPLVLLGCTPAFLAAAGFTAGGIAAGSIAAGIQAGIGSVAAGSVFATLTSAAMGGFGVPIVLGSVWGISSALIWGAAAWRRWRGK